MTQRNIVCIFSTIKPIFTSFFFFKLFIWYFKKTKLFDDRENIFHFKLILSYKHNPHWFCNDLFSDRTIKKLPVSNLTELVQNLFILQTFE